MSQPVSWCALKLISLASIFLPWSQSSWLSLYMLTACSPVWNLLASSSSTMAGSFSMTTARSSGSILILSPDVSTSEYKWVPREGSVEIGVGDGAEQRLRI